MVTEKRSCSAFCRINGALLETGIRCGYSHQYTLLALPSCESLQSKLRSCEAVKL